VIADFDDDGHLDLATPHYYQNTVTVHWNDGAGGFPTSTSFPTGSGPGAIAAGDLDGDGVADLLTGSQNSGGPNTVSLLRGNGSRSFATPVSAPTGDYPIALALGDIDGDKRLEILTADHLDNTVTVLRNTLATTSTPPLPTPTQFTFGPVMPNPSRGSLRIAFSLPQRAHVQIDIHDIMGRHVGQITDAEYSAGRQVVAWTKPVNRGFTPGIYVIRCQMGGRSFVQRVTFRK
jgi:hypothetical protein